MINQGNESHLVLDMVHKLQDAVVFGDIPPNGEIGDIKTKFISAEDISSGYPVPQLDLFDGRTGIHTSVVFAPSIDTRNPMTFFDKQGVFGEREELVPVLAKVLLRSENGVTILSDETKRQVVKSIMFRVLEGGIHAEYDKDRKFTSPKNTIGYRVQAGLLVRKSPISRLLDVA